MSDAAGSAIGRGRAAVSWPPRLRKSQIRRLYASIPTERLNEELVDDVGISLYMRCRAIVTISRAKQGEVLCPVCDKGGTEHYIRRSTRYDPGQVIRCSACGWEITWGDYQHSFQRRQFNEGGAGKGFRRYLEDYPRCRTAWEKMLAIDLLIHEFHFSLRAEPDRPTRAVCVNLIEGKLTDVVACLNEISGVAATHPEMAEHYRGWKANCEVAGHWHPK
jgi:hypothetical protein